MYYKSSDFSVGLKVEVSNQPYVILKNEFVKPGKGQAFNKLKLKNILNSSILIKTVKIGSRLKKADIFLVDVKYIYKDNNLCYFMNEVSLEYHEVSFDVISESVNWLIDGLNCSLLFWNEVIVSIKLPRFIDFKVISVESFSKSSLLSNKLKTVLLESGAYLKVPFFIKVDDYVKVDVEKKVYISRVNKV